MTGPEAAWPVRDTARGVSIAVRVQPRAKKTAITGVFGAGTEAAIKVALAASPVDGRANDALVAFFAALTGTPRSAVEILSGAGSRNKVVHIAGRSAAEVRQILDSIHSG